MSFTTEDYQITYPKCCFTMVLDVSDSIDGTSINELNQGLKHFYDEIKHDCTAKNNLEIALVQFSNNVKILTAPSLVEDFTLPILEVEGDSSSVLADGIREGISIVRTAKSWYKKTGQSYYRPWVVLFTKGIPDKSQDIDCISAEIKNAAAQKEFHFLAVGMPGADMDVLRQISNPSMPPALFQDINFSKFLKWLIIAKYPTNLKMEDVVLNIPSPPKFMEYLYKTI